ncbi:hypothetical protein LPJ68_001838 [Coemansia sp. RSA 1086]|nr:hypothetical protein LPJ68_001838 [Coemansia sp. RSA 1086]
MNRKNQPATNAKTSSSKRPTSSYSQYAGANTASSASPSGSDKATHNAAAPQTKPTSFSAAAKQGKQQRSPENVSDTPANGAPSVNSRGNGAGSQHGRNAPVRLPSRNSVSSIGTSAIQFGSLNQQTRPSSPPATYRPSGAAATSGGVPSTIGKSTPKPNFGSITGTAEDSGRRPPSRNAHGTSESPSRNSHHGRHGYNQRPGSRSSGHGRQSQGYTPGRKDSNSSNSNYKHNANGPKGGYKLHDAPGSDAGSHLSAEGSSYTGTQPIAMPMPGGLPAQPSAGNQQQMPHYAGSPYRNHSPHVRPAHSQSPNPYKPQSGTHYPSHHMGSQPMTQSMAYPMPAPGQPIQPQIMTTQPNMQPMQGWVQPPHQFAYMPMGGPGYDQFYHSPQAGGVPPPHSIYGVPGYSMPNPTHAVVSSQIGAGGIMPGPIGGAPMPGMTASPMPGQQPMPPHQQHGLSASAQSFVPGRRAVRIVNPETKEEIDISQQRLRSVSTASSTPHHVASGTASPAHSAAADKSDVASAAEDSKPKFRIPSTRAIKIVNPNAPSKPEAGDAAAKPAAPEAKPAEATAAETTSTAEVEKPSEPDAAADKAAEKADDTGAKPMDIDEKPAEPKEETPAAEAEAPAADTPAPAEEPATVSTEPESEADKPTVDELADALAKTEIADDAKEEPSSAPAQEGAKEESMVAEPEDVVQSPTDASMADKQPEEGEITESAGSKQPQSPPSLSQSRSRQVTFSEPVAPSVQVLKAQDVVARYSSEGASAPLIVDEILRYPQAFLEKFNGRCKPPTTFHFEIASSDERWSDRSSSMRRSGSGRHRESPTSSGFGGMGNFRTSHAPLGSSEERFRQSTMELKNRGDGRGSMMGGRSASGHRGLGGNRESRGGRSGGRGRGRGRGRGGSQAGGDRQSAAEAAAANANAKPLEKSENRYIARSLLKSKNEPEDEMSEAVYDRQIRALLNKITPDNFDTVSEELLGWGEKSSKETDGRILRHLIMLVFKKATDEPMWAQLYARLCHRMICNTSNAVQDHSLLTKDGGYLSGGYLVRKYLLTKCQEEFERGWKVEIPKDIESAEYYEAIKIKRRGLGLVEFIGKLFLFDILTLRIMHECVKRLLSNVETPEEEETESLAKLMTTVGKKLDVPNAKAYMDAYFARIQTMANNKHLSSRIRFMLKDLIDLRQKNWVTRTTDAGPKTIAEIHEDIERAKAAEAAMRRAPSHTGRRSDSHAGRGEGHGGRRSGWNTVGGASGSGRNDQSQRAGDLSHFGNLSRSKQQSAATGLPSNPFGALTGGSRGWRNGSSDGRKARDDRSRQATSLSSAGRTSSHSSRAESNAANTPESVGTRNMFDALMNADEDAHMSPRNDAVRDTSRVPPLAKAAMSKTEAPKPLGSAAIQSKVRGFMDEYMQLNSDEELIECFKELGEINYQGAVYELANYIVDRKPEDAEKLGQAARVLRDSNTLSEDVFVAGLAEYSEQLEDMALDSPNAYNFFGLLMAYGKVPLTRLAEPLGELATKLSRSKPPALNVVFAYFKQRVKEDGESDTKAQVEKANFDIAQFMNKERRSRSDILQALETQGLEDVFPY